MIVYKFLHINFKLILFIFCASILNAQENNESEQLSPQNLIPDVDSITTPVTLENNEFSGDSDISKEVTITELPRIAPSWIGIISDEDSSLGWYMWDGTDANFAKMLL